MYPVCVCVPRHTNRHALPGLASDSYHGPLKAGTSGPEASPEPAMARGVGRVTQPRRGTGLSLGGMRHE